MAAVYDELILAGVLNEAGVDELAHHVGGQLAGLGILGQLHHLLLQGVDLCILGILLGYLLSSSLLGSLNLCLGAASLGADLKHVRRHALRHWMINEMRLERRIANTYEKRAWKPGTWRPAEGPLLS